MERLLLLGVDVGTSGSKGVLIDIEGRILAQGYTEHDASRSRSETHRDYMRFYSIYRKMCDRVKDLHVEDAEALGIV